MILTIAEAMCALCCGCVHEHARAGDYAYQSYMIESDVRRFLDSNTQLSEEERRAGVERIRAHRISQNVRVGRSQQELRNELGEPVDEWRQTLAEATKTIGFNPKQKLKRTVTLRYLFFQHADRDVYVWLANNAGDDWVVVTDYDAPKGTRF